MLKALQQAKPEKGTQTGSSLHALAERLHRRGLTVIISDLLDDVPAILSGLEHLRHDGHEVIVFHLLDRAEVDFPYDRMTLFEGMESLPNLLVDAKDLRESYLSEFKKYSDVLRKGCLGHQIEYIQIPTDIAMDVALVGFLGKRAAHARGRR